MECLLHVLPQQSERDACLQGACSLAGEKNVNLNTTQIYACAANVAQSEDQVFHAEGRLPAGLKGKRQPRVAWTAMGSGEKWGWKIKKKR